MSEPRNDPSANDEAIEAIAASWLVQQAEGLSPAQAAEFARWRAADPRHAEAVAMLEEAETLLQRMPRLREDPVLAAELEELRKPSSPLLPAPRAARSSARVLRFPRWIGAAAALAACIALAFIWQRSSTATAASSQTHFTTAAGEFRRVVLSDRSVVDLNADSDLRVEFSPAARRVALSRGEAHFTVAKDPSRPFSVRSGAIAVRAVGTAFNVRVDPTNVDVLVTEGRVQVTRGDDSSAASSPAYSAGQRIIVATDPAAPFSPQVSSVSNLGLGPPAPRPAPRLVFADTPLAEVVHQFNQHNATKLRVDDPDLAQRPVGGIFQADQVEVFVRLLERNNEVAVERPTPQLIILRKP